MKKLNVKKERLAELTIDELSEVAGGAPPSFQGCTTAMSCGCPLTYPLSQRICVDTTN